MEKDQDTKGGDRGPLRSLSELAPLFNDVSIYAPYMYAEVQITVKMYLDHPESEDTDGVATHCTVAIEAPVPSCLPEDTDPLLVGNMEKNVTSFIINGVETATPTISLQDVIEAFHLDIDSPIWQLGYE